MNPKPVLPLLLAAALLAWPLTAASAAVRPDQRLDVGTRVNIKGLFRGTVFEAQEIEAAQDGSGSVKGTIDRYDPATGELRFGALRLQADERTRFRDAAGNDIDPATLRPGQRVKASLRVDDSGEIRVRRVRIMPGDSPSRLRLEGAVQSVVHTETETYIQLLGQEVRATARTAWDGIVRPRSFVDDEDVRPARGVQLGRFTRLSGELRLDYKSEQNYDLADEFESDETAGRGRGRLELTFQPRGRVSGMLQVKAEEERELEDQNDALEDRSKLTLGRAYVQLDGILGRHVSLQVGRSRFDDRRDWLFNRDIDALRVFADWARFRVELAVAEELVDPVKRHRDVRNTYLAATAYPGKRHAITAYVLDRDDRGLTDAGAPRDFSPRIFGLSLSGKLRKTFGYWAELARARGTIRGTQLDGEAFDAGVTLIVPSRLEPSLTLGYAMGSGDDDPLDDTDRTFRQSGLQLNNGKWNGVSSFRYYGEISRPELANLHIETIGVGIRPRRKTSLDLVYHRYRLDVPASELVEASYDDRRLNLLDTEIGEEWNLIAGFEELRHFEFEVNLGYFEPGRAFLGPIDPATLFRLKVKYVF